MESCEDIQMQISQFNLESNKALDIIKIAQNTLNEILLLSNSEEMDNIN